MKISYSRLAEYAECPRRFFYRYVEERSLPKPSEDLILGTVFHKLLNFIFSPSLLPPSQEEIEAHLRSLLSGKLEAERLEEALFMGRKVIANLLEEDKTNLLAIEYNFSLSLGRHTITGRMDRVDRHNNGEIEIIEYKLHGGSKEKLDLQLILYHLAAEEIWHPPRILLSVVSFLDNKREQFLLTTQEIIEGRERIINLASGIEREDFAPLRGGHCLQCPFAEVCFREFPERTEELL